jgi:hypothetical protein
VGVAFLHRSQLKREFGAGENARRNSLAICALWSMRYYALVNIAQNCPGARWKGPRKEDLRISYEFSHENIGGSFILGYCAFD